MTKFKVSAVIPTYNVVGILENTLRSIRWADEIIVIDMNSDDGTRELALKYGAKVINRMPKGNFDENRKYGMLLAKNEWILKIDSDEILSVNLQNEIKHFLLFADKKAINGIYFLNNIHMFGGIVRHGFVKRKSHELRLFKKGRWKYNPYRLHQQITVRGKTDFFENTYIHYNYPNVSCFIEKMNKYTTLDAKVLSKEIKNSIILMVFSPFKTFTKLFLFQAGFLDGMLGIETSIMLSFYYLVERIKIWEIQKAN